MLAVMDRLNAAAPGPWRDAVTLQGFFYWVAALEDGRLVRPREVEGGRGGGERRGHPGRAPPSRPKLVVRGGWLVREDEGEAAAVGEDGVMSSQALLHQ